MRLKQNIFEGLLILLMLVILVGCGGAEQRASAHMERGVELFESGNYEKARLEFKNVLKIDPRNIAALYRLGQVHEYDKEWKLAGAAYNRIIELDDGHIDARVRLGRMYLAGKITDKAAVLADEAMSRDSTNVGALTLRAGVRAQQKNFDGAQQDLLVALETDPVYSDAIMLLASVYVKKQQPDKAITLLDNAVAKLPEKKTLRALLAQIYSMQGDTRHALEQLKAIVALEPEKLSHRVRVAGYLVKLNRKNEAEKVLEEAVTRQPDSIDAKLVRVNFLADQGENSKAEAQLKFYIEQQPEIYRFQFALAGFYQHTGDTGKVKSVYRNIIDKNRLGPDGLKARTRLALILIQMDDADSKVAGEKLLEEVLKENPGDNDALLLRGRLALNRQDATTAIADFRTVARDQPDSPMTLKLLAEAHLQNREPELARDSLEKAVRLRPSDNEIRLSLARILLQENQTDQAIEHLSAVLKKNPQQSDALELLFQGYVVSKDWKAAGDVAKKVRTYYPDQAAGFYYTGIVYQGQGRYKQSSTQFEKALEESPKAIDILSALIKSYLAQNKPGQALAKLDDVLAEAKDNYTALNFKGEVLMIRKDTDAAVLAFRQVIQLKPDFVAGYRNLALAYLAKDDKDAAIRVYVDGIRVSDNSSVLQVELAALYERVGQNDAAIETYENLLNAQPDSATLANNLAMLLVTYRQDQASLDRAGQLVATLGDNPGPQYLDTRGWVFYKRGEIDAAIPLMNRAVSLSPEEPQLRYHLGLAYYDKGDMVLAKEHLGRAVVSGSNFPGKKKARKILDKITQS